VGITLRIPDFDPGWYIDSEWPVPEGLAAIFLLYGSAAEAVINRVDPDAPGVITGSPAFDADSGTFSQTNWLDTNAGGSTEGLSLWGVFRLPASGEHAYVSNFSTGTGDSILVTAAQLRASGAGGTGAASVSLSTTGIGAEWFFGCATFDVTATRIYLGRAGVLTGGSSGGDRSPLAADDFRIGRGVTAFTTQPADHMLAGIHHRALNSGDVTTLFAWCRAHAEALGITDLTS